MLATVISQQRNRFDSDAQAYIDAVETADSQILELGVRWSINQLVLDMKTASVWTPTSSMVLKMAARTLAGSLIDLKNPGSSWTNGGGLFLSADYNRTTGLLGDGSTKYLDSGRNNNAEAQNSHTLFTRVSSPATTSGMCYMGAGYGDTGSNVIAVHSTTSATIVASRNSSFDIDTGANAAGLIGIWRQNDAASFVSVGNNASQGFTRTSETPYAQNIYDFATNLVGVANNFSDARTRISGIGSYMNLFTLDTQLTTFINRITALGL